MHVIVKLFSVAKDLAGFDEERVQLQEGATANEVMLYLAQRNSKFEEWKASIRLAVNYEYVANSHPLRDGDEVAVLPPVSGG